MSPRSWVEAFPARGGIPEEGQRLKTTESGAGRDYRRASRLCRSAETVPWPSCPRVPDARYPPKATSRRLRPRPRRSGRHRSCGVSMRQASSMGSTLRIAMEFGSAPGSAARADPRGSSLPAPDQASGQQFLDHLAAVDDLDGPVAGGHQLLVGDDAHLVVDGGGEVLGADRVALGLAGGGVGERRGCSPS